MNYVNKAGPRAERSLLAHRALAEVSRVRILEELRRAGRPLAVAELAEQIGLHHNTVRAHLEVLRKAGLVVAEAEKRTVPGRPRIVYQPALEAVPGEEGDGYRLLASILTSYLAASSDPGLAAAEAGQTWGRYLVERPKPFQRVDPEDAIRRVSRLLEELGFAPETVMEEGEARILLHRCPFRELAVYHPEVTCAVHLGLIEGALAELGVRLAATRIDPFVGPLLCVAHLARQERARRMDAGAPHDGSEGLVSPRTELATVVSGPSPAPSRP
jgi:predicted ArsR family transcriptional regulator